VAWWQLRQARRAGDVLRDAVVQQWPEDAPARPGTRRQLLGAAERLGAGDFGAIVERLGPVPPPTPSQQDAARRFFAANDRLRERFVRTAAEAEAMAQGESDAGPVRDELGRALLAAARRDAAAVARHLDLAEATLEEAAWGDGPMASGGPEAALAAEVRAIEPAFLLGRELLLEGHTAVEQLLARAAGNAREGQFREALGLVRLARELTGVDAAAADVAAEAELPEWFTELPPPEPAPATADGARAAVELCRAAAASLDASPALRAVIDRAERELAAGREADAQWFAGVALSALGIGEEAVAENDDRGVTQE
jgi:hypothetical protein